MLLFQALDAYEVSYLTLTGQKDIKTRHEIIEQFRTGKTQVLLLSNVGRVGINLSVANILIVLVRLSIWK
jgi:SNF2 family DNA or RNA helicase